MSCSFRSQYLTLLRTTISSIPSASSFAAVNSGGTAISILSSPVVACTQTECSTDAAVHCHCSRQWASSFFTLAYDVTLVDVAARCRNVNLREVNAAAQALDCYSFAALQIRLGYHQNNAQIQEHTNSTIRFLARIALVSITRGIALRFSSSVRSI